jgi:trk system potassium uptake protein TrkH
MNFKLVFRITGATLLLEGAAMILPMMVAIVYREDPFPFIKAIFILMIAGLLLCLLLKPDHSFFAREGFFTVGLIWILFGVFGALPFWFSGRFGSYVDCLFETVSGFTTTGATILTAIEGLPYGLLFWRSFTHWLGGMGVLILTTALLPSLGISSNYLIRAESPGPVTSKLVPKASDSSKILYSIYLGLTLVETFVLRIVGMNWYDAVIHAMSTAGTGGFSIKNLSIGSYGSPAIEVVITIFMLLFSINFAVYFLMLCGKWKNIMKSDELRFFLGMVVLSTGAIAWNLRDLYTSAWDSIRHAAFQVASIVSTTGFSSADFDQWPEFSRMLLVLLMFIGACAGSTGGGIKCARILVLFKTIRREICSIIHPRSVTVVKLDGETVSENTLRTIQSFFVTYMFFIFAAALIVGLDNFSFGTTLTSVITCVSNVGPGLEKVGPTGNFSEFSILSKLTLSFCMIVGRLEVFPMLVLFSRNAWKHS